MNRVIGTNKILLSHKKPEGNLGDFFADAIREQASLVFHKNIEISFFNYGGLRLPEIAAGAITVSTVFELMPFDNEIVLMNLRSDLLLKVLEYSANRGGDPLSGIRYRIKDNKPVDIFINDMLIDTGKTYLFVTNDYLADGGDNMSFMKSIPRIKGNIKLRDMLIDYFKLHPVPLNKSTDGRVQIYE